MSKPTEHFWVNGVVAARDKKPYIQLSTEDGLVVQLDIAQARNVAADILQMAARTEADAMVLMFFSKSEFPDGAAAQLMMDFREFRAELDQVQVERKVSE